MCLGMSMPSPANTASYISAHIAHAKKNHHEAVHAPALSCWSEYHWSHTKATKNHTISQPSPPDFADPFGGPIALKIAVQYAHFPRPSQHPHTVSSRSHLTPHISTKPSTTLMPLS